MDFPDMQSLINAAEVHEFRKPDDNETEEHYRQALADHVKPRDLIESEEIRNGSGWDKWNEKQMRALLGHAEDALNLELKPMPDYGDLIPIENFIEAVKCNALIPYDGSGYYATRNQMSNKDIDWKELKNSRYDKQWTHIAWFNK